MSGSRLIVFLKEPRPGRVKSRLAKEVGTVAAAHWYRRQCRSLLTKVAGSPKWETILAVTPDAEGLASRVWPPSLVRMPQGTGDLGKRMARAFGNSRQGPAIIIGSDVPSISAARIEGAFRLLGRSDAVFGPSPDGGFWLVGLKHPSLAPTTLFRNVRWSSKFAMQDSLAALSGKRVAFTETLADVDTLADLQRLGSERTP